MIHGCDFKLVPGPEEQSPALEMESSLVEILYRTSVNHSDEATVLQGCWTSVQKPYSGSWKWPFIHGFVGFFKFLSRVFWYSPKANEKGECPKQWIWVSSIIFNAPGQNNKWPQNPNAGTARSNIFSSLAQVTATKARKTFLCIPLLSSNANRSLPGFANYTHHVSDIFPAKTAQLPRLRSPSQALPRGALAVGRGAGGQTDDSVRTESCPMPWGWCPFCWTSICRVSLGRSWVPLVWEFQTKKSPINQLEVQGTSKPHVTSWVLL